MNKLTDETGQTPTSLATVATKSLTKTEELTGKETMTLKYDHYRALLIASIFNQIISHFYIQFFGLGEPKYERLFDQRDSNHKVPKRDGKLTMMKCVSSYNVLPLKYFLFPVILSFS